MFIVILYSAEAYGPFNSLDTLFEFLKTKVTNFDFSVDFVIKKLLPVGDHAKATDKVGMLEYCIGGQFFSGKINAIKHYRNKTACSLLEAKLYVEGLPIHE